MKPKSLQNEVKAIEIILYLSKKLKQPNFHQIFKILYFADKFHLEYYGRLIMDDIYIAMKNGPVPSYSYNLLKEFRTCPPENPAFVIENNYKIKTLRDPNIEYLSKSEAECLDKSVECYGNYSFNELTRLSHDTAWESADANGIISIEEIIKTIPNHQDLLEHLNLK